MPFLKKILKWFLIFSIVSITPIICFFKSDNFSWIDYVADFVTILGIGGIIWQYKKGKETDFINKTKEQLRAINSIKYQLEVIGKWTNFDRGGYSQGNASNYLSDWSNLNKIVFEIEGCAIENILSLPAIENFDEEILKSIAFLNQNIKNFNTVLSEIRITRNSLLIELKKYKGIEKDEKILEFQGDIYVLYRTLHIDVISNSEGRGLHYWHQKLKYQLDLLEVELKYKLSN